MALSQVRLSPQRVVGGRDCTWRYRAALRCLLESHEADQNFARQDVPVEKGQLTADS